MHARGPEFSFDTYSHTDVMLFSILKFLKKYFLSHKKEKRKKKKKVIRIREMLTTHFLTHIF